MKRDDKYLLKSEIRKKMTTTMIAALEAFENEFGYLWAIDKTHQDDLTEDERYFDEKWLAAREAILEKGNAQIGAIMKELDKYEISQRIYSYKFYQRGNNGRN